jgi:PAS domain S-box-containing protein
MNHDMEDPSTVLLVDDNPQNLAALSKILAEHGYNIRTAINGQVALKSVQTILPDLILLDIRMPELDGYAVCQQLKADTTTREIPVLFLSALDHLADKVKAFDIGGVDYITKPFQADEVIARVETHLALRNIQKQLQRQNMELQQYRYHLEELVAERTVELQEEIAERKRVEQTLRLSERLYRLLAETVNDGIVIIQNGELILTNTAFAAMLGYSKEELFRADFVSLFQEIDQKKIQNKLARHLADEPSNSSWQVELVAKKGHVIWIEAFQVPIVWESQAAML